MELDPSSIIVGDRARKRPDKNIEELCRSIKELGQLQPILIRRDGHLVCGARRLRACQILGIPVKCHQVDSMEDAIQRFMAERDENTCREQFTPSELAKLGKAIEAVERPLAECRKTAGIPPSGKFPDGQTGNTRDKVGEALGVSGKTYEKIKAVVAAAESPDASEEVVEAARIMEETGAVDPSYKVVQAAELQKPASKDPTKKPAKKRTPRRTKRQRIELNHGKIWLKLMDKVWPVLNTCPTERAEWIANKFEELIKQFRAKHGATT